MNNKGKIKLYNILLPIWVLLFWPSLLWLFLIPANYIVDRIVLKFSLGKMKDKGKFCKKHTWKVCLAGFLTDAVGVIFLFGVFILFAVLSGDSSGETFLDKISNGIAFNPFSNIVAFFIVIASIFGVGLLIYVIDKKILKKAGLKGEQLKKTALYLAIITAPYLFLFPTDVLYNFGILGM